jgi:Pyridoxamine 5''-phosphate oxidase.
MGILTDDMKRLIDEQKLAFHATVCPDGSPNLSPKGSTRVWDDDHLFFADICSPQTTANIRAGRSSRSTWSTRSCARATGSRARRKSTSAGRPRSPRASSGCGRTARN